MNRIYFNKGNFVSHEAIKWAVRMIIKPKEIWAILFKGAKKKMKRNVNPVLKKSVKAVEITGQVIAVRKYLYL